MEQLQNSLDQTLEICHMPNFEISYHTKLYGIKINTVILYYERGCSVELLKTKIGVCPNAKNWEPPV